MEADVGGAQAGEGVLGGEMAGRRAGAVAGVVAKAKGGRTDDVPNGCGGIEALDIGEHADVFTSWTGGDERNTETETDDN